MVRWTRVGVVSWAAVSSACGGVPNEPQQTVESGLVVSKGEVEEQPIGRVFSAEMIKGKVRYLTPTDLPTSAREASDDAANGLADAGPFAIEGELHPRLLADVESVEERALVEGRGVAEQRVDVVVTFKQRTKLPRFPELNEHDARDSSENQAVLTRTESLVSSIAAQRGKVHDASKALLEQRYGLIELERFWLVDSLLASVPLSKVRELTRHPDVQYVEYNKSDAPPPTNNTIYDDRQALRSDVFYGYTGGYIGMLDSGVRNTHTLLSNRIALYRDCTAGLPSTCSGPTPSDCYSGGHGTAAASIMSGNNNWDDPNRGISQVTIDSFKVYSNSLCGYDVTAGQRGFANALAVGDKVILANIQEQASYTGNTATAANNAFDAGAVVMAAAGNYGSGASSVTSPGNATKALAVGAVDVGTKALQGYSGRGPTSDGRTKPDVTAPTNIWAAGSDCDGCFTPQTFGGTSAATPSATGAAALARNFLIASGSGANPGQVYALLIMSGQNFNSPATNNNEGSGLINLYAGDVSIGWGSVSLASQTSTDISVTRNS